MATAATFDGVTFESEPARDRFTDHHTVGELRKHDGRVYQVGMVSDMRMRLDPVSGTPHQLLAKTFTTYGDPVNLSPRALLERVDDDTLTEEQRARAERMAQKESRMVVAAPVAPKPKANAAAPAGKSAAEKNRQAALAAKKETKAAEKVASPVAKKVKETHPCACGCGEPVTGHFAQGHDARFKGWLLAVERGKMKVTELPPSVQTGYKWVKKGDGMVPTTNYKGEPHTGYDIGEKAAKVAAAPKAKGVGATAKTAGVPGA